MSKWEYASLGELAEEITVGFVGPMATEYIKEGIPFLRSQNVIPFLIDTNDIKFISSPFHQKLKKSALKPNDVVIVRTGKPGASAVIPKSLPIANCSDLVIVRCGKRLDPDFTSYFINSVNKTHIQAHIVGAVQQHFNVGSAKQIQIPNIKIEEQIHIASILKALDDKINLLQRQNKTLEQLAETLFRQFFVEEIEWKGNLSEYVKVQGGYAFKSKDFKTTGFAGVIKIRNISMGIIDISNSDFVDEGVVKNLDKRFKIKSGDFLIAMTGAEIGKIGIVQKTESEIWLNQRVGKLEATVPYGNTIGYLALKLREGQDHITNACAGSAQENISTTGIEEMIFASYDSEKTNQFGEQVQPFFDKIIFNHNQIKTLSKLRDTLLPKLMSGEVRVNNVN